MSAGPRPVRVAVDAVAERPERTFSYLLPSELGEASPGSLLLVPYGRRLALGYLLPGGSDVAVEGLKTVEAIVSEPMLTPDLLALAEDIATYYRAPIGTTLAAMLPPGLESRLVRTWVVASADALPDDLRPLVDKEGKIGDASLQRHGPRRGRTAWLEQLRRSGAIRAEWSLRAPEVSARRVRVVRALRSDADPPRRAPTSAARRRETQRAS